VWGGAWVGVLGVSGSPLFAPSLLCARNSPRLRASRRRSCYGGSFFSFHGHCALRLQLCFQHQGLILLLLLPLLLLLLFLFSGIYYIPITWMQLGDGLPSSHPKLDLFSLWYLVLSPPAFWFLLPLIAFVLPSFLWRWSHCVLISMNGQLNKLAALLLSYIYPAQ